MDNAILKQIIIQIKKYNLTSSFADIEKFNEWISKLNSTQINNFINLDIDLEEIKNLKHLLINSDLLNCNDYKQKVKAIASLKNGDGCWHLFDVICRPNFLNSKNFYKDLEMLSKADTARYGLWILGEDTFINSPYHDEDLKLLVETRDTARENPLDFVVSAALATVAGNSASIKSQYHQADMKLIATSGSDCLQMSHSYPERGLNNLAVNAVSLNDKYHLENMQILATNPIAGDFLYIIMTDSRFVKGKNYRKEIEALLNAKSKVTARALYYYIVNPERKYLSDTDFLKDYEHDINDAHISDRNSVAGKNDPDYLNNLEIISKIDDKFVMYFVSLLMNPSFIHSPAKKFDIGLLQRISIKSIFMDLYMLMSDEQSLNSIYHKKDAIIISQTMAEAVRDLLLEKACNKYSLQSINHEYDMEFITKLNLDSIAEKIYFEMHYYLFKRKGIDDPKHIEKLEKLLQGIFVERSDSVSDYLDDLQIQIEESESDDFQLMPTMPNRISKEKPMILKLIKNHIKRKKRK